MALVSHFRVDQNSDRWWKLRAGIPTASHFKDVMAEPTGKVRQKYLERLRDEYFGREVDRFSSHHTRRGHAREPRIRDKYEFYSDNDVRTSGFWRVFNPTCGGSPDGLVGTEGVVEFKSVLPEILIDLHETNRWPKQHLPQLQGELLVTGRRWVDLMVDGGDDLPPLIKRIERDERYITRITNHLVRFNRDLKELIGAELAHKPTTKEMLQQSLGETE